MVKDYDSSLPRPDQIKAYANRISKELVNLLELLKTLLVSDSIDPKAISAMCNICDDFCFVMPKYLYKHEYIRMEYDSFGRIVKMNEAKRKCLWITYLLIKVLIMQLFAKYPEAMNTKPSKSVLLSVKMLCSVIHNCTQESIKKTTKIINNNDVNMPIERKPEIRDEDILDPSVKLVKPRPRKAGEETPAIKDIFDQDQMKDALSTGFTINIVVGEWFDLGRDYELLRCYLRPFQYNFHCFKGTAKGY